jgi:hypothetical protein
VPVVLSLLLFCLGARIRKHFVTTKRRNKVSSSSLFENDLMEGTHKRFGEPHIASPNKNRQTSGRNSSSTVHTSSLNRSLGNKLSDPTIGVSDTVTNGLVMRTPRKLSHDPPAPVAHEDPAHSSKSETESETKEREGLGLNSFSQCEKDIEISPRVEEIREQTLLSSRSSVVPIGYDSQPISLGYSADEQLSHMEQRPSAAPATVSANALPPHDARPRTSSEIESGQVVMLPLHDDLAETTPPDSGLKRLHSHNRSHRPKYRGAFSFQESLEDHDEEGTAAAGGGAGREEGSHSTKNKRRVLQRKLSKKMSGTMKRIFSRVVSHSFSLTGYDNSSDDFDSSDEDDDRDDFSVSRGSFDSEDESDEDDDYHGLYDEEEDGELDVLSIDKEIATQTSHKRFPMSP